MDLCDAFLRGPYDALLMVDMDMLVPPDGLEKLRAHDLDMVSGHYFRRDTSPLMSICQVIDEERNAQVPLVDVPDSGLMEIAMTGMGFVLIKREVIEAVWRIPNIVHPFAPGPVPEMGHNELYGQDVRFFFYARKLGYKLWLDAGVECMHGCTVWLSKYLYDILRPHQDAEWEKEWSRIRWVQKRIINNAQRNWKSYAAKLQTPAGRS